MNTATNPKVSILVPLYQMGHRLKRALMSAASQTLTDIEIVVVDDNSNDDGFELAAKIARDDTRFRIYQNDRTRGLWHTRKRVIAEAHGEFILFLDPREWLDNDAAEVLLYNIRQSEADLIQMNRRLVSTFRKKSETEEKLGDMLVSGEEYYKMIRRIGRGAYISPFCGDKLYRADILRESLAFDFKSTWGEVQLLNIQYLRHARSVKFIDYEGVNVTWRDDYSNYNVSRLKDYKNLYCMKKLIGQDEEFIRNELIENLHYHIEQLTGELAWTPEAAEFFLTEELQDPFWRNMGMDLDAAELVALHSHGNRTTVKQIIKRLFT